MKKLARFLCLVLAAVTLCITLIACGSDPITTADAAKAALQEKDYTVVTESTAADIAAYAALNVKGVTSVLHATNEDGEQAHVFFFADEAGATAAMTAVTALSNDAKATAAEGTEWADPAQSGGMIYFGTVDGVKLFQ